MIPRPGTSRLLAVSAGVLLSLGAGYSVGYPGPVFETAAPVLAPQIQTAEFPSGTFSVSSRTGAGQYSYPIFVPPGRQGMQPALTLTYSSRNPMRGGLAVGWRLEVPSIRVDTSRGRLAGTNYLSTLAGGQRLIPVNEPAQSAGVQTFRAEQDASYTRYEKVQLVPANEFFWRALRPDGTTYIFGEATARDPPDAETGATEGRWFVSRIGDRFGNEVLFQYEAVMGSARNGELQNIPIDIALIGIDYTMNPRAGLLSHARIEFEYASQLDLCPGSAVPIGAQFSYRTGLRVYEGARRLDRITTRVRQTPEDLLRVRRIVELSYDQNELKCRPTGQGLHAPVRLLTAIRERGFSLSGEETNLPPTRFTYGILEHNFSQAASIPALAATEGDVGSGKEPLNETKGGGWPTIDEMLADLNGDAAPDLLRSRELQAPEFDVLCSVQWQRNAGGGALDEPAIAALPTLPWANATPGSPFGFRNDGIESARVMESCSLAYQFTRRSNKPLGDAAGESCRGTPSNYLSYRLLDLDGDGDLDLATSLDYKRGRYSPKSDSVLGNLSLHGAMPACPLKPLCRNQAGQAVPCRTRSDIGVLFILPDDSPAPDAGFPEECPSNECRSPFCIPKTPGTPSPTFPDPQLPGSDVPFVGGACGCSITHCQTFDKAGQWDPPSISDDWSGPPFVPGDVGSEERPSHGGNRWCEQVPEMTCGLGEGASLEAQSRFMYVWRVHWNVGDGIFPGDSAETSSAAEQPSEIANTPPSDVFLRKPEIHLSPLPLETDRAVSATGGEPASSWTGFVDIDGDGFLDAVWQEPVVPAPHMGPTGWPGQRRTGRFLVFRGDGKGNFLPKQNGDPYTWMEPHVSERPRVALERAGYVNRRTNDELHRSGDTLVTLEDMNGDGLPDLIDSRDLDDQPFQLRAFLNTGSGFEPRPTILSGALPTLSRRIQVVLNKYPNEQTRNGWTVFERRPIDLDQDGLLDVVAIRPPADGQTNPWLIPVTSAPRSGLVPSVGSPSSDSVVAPADTPESSTDPIGGLDAPDLDEAALPETPPVVAHFNVGDQLIPGGSNATLIAWRPGLARIQLAVDEIGDRGVWKIKTDLMDLDGDGLAELFNNDELDPKAHCEPTQAGAVAGLCGRSSKVLVDGSSEDPAKRARGLRLLASVDNGQGATIRFNYAAGTDSNVVETDSRRGRRNPAAIWVVSSLDVQLKAGPSSTTNYLYRLPVLNRDRQGGFAFRGFEEVLTQHPVNAQGLRRTTVERYDYGLDFSGLMVDRVVQAADQSIVRIESMLWQKAELFGGAVLAFHPKETHRRVCDSTNNQSEAACRKGGALRRQIMAWAPVLTLADPLPMPDFDTLAHEATHPNTTGTPGTSSANQPGHKPERDELCGPAAAPGASLRAVLYVSCGERLTDRPGGAVKRDRGALRVHKLLYSDTTYRLLEVEERRIVAAGDGTLTAWGPIATSALKRNVYDDGRLGLPVESHMSLDESTMAVTRRTFDTSTGNVRSTQRPNQIAAATALNTTFEYEPFRIYAKATVNEAGHRVSITTDLANGRTLLTEGPEQPGVGLPTNRTVLDGLGRVRARFRSVETQGGLAQRLYSRSQYFDEETPTRIRTEDIIEHDGTQFVVTDRAYDGLARLLSEEVKTTSGPAVGRYGYDGAGNLVSLAFPNPRDETSDAVYRYEYDAVGRLTRSIPPIGSPLAISYDGLTIFRTEMPGDGSKAKPVKVAHDVFGRLVKVAEKGPEGDATTTYAYDANDNLERMEDADGVVTVLKHDMGNRRVAVERGGRTWEYRYDLDGNQIAEVSPHVVSDDKEAFTTRYGYDPIGRLVSRHPGPRRLTADQVERYGLGPTFLHYDTLPGRNTVGRVARVDLPFGEIEYDYNAEGWPVEERRRFDIVPLDTGTGERSIQAQYNALGQPVRKVHVDGTVSITRYDDRGLPVSSLVELASTPVPTLLLLAELTRQRNGMPIQRKAFGQLQEWHYDDRGRVIDHSIKLGASIFGGETLVYDDVGNMKSLTNRASNVGLEFTYDSQHQLTGVSGSTPDVYDAEYRYSAGGRVVGVRVESLVTGSAVFARDVVHDYVGDPPAADPAAVRRLLPADGSPTPFATYDYDESGNVVRRMINGTTWDLVYDGYDEMREATLMSAAGAAAREIYYYDHSGRRILTVREPLGEEPAEARYWFGGDEIRFDAAGRQISSISTILLDGRAIASIVDGAKTNPHLNYHGVLWHLLGMVTSSGSIASRFSYGPYGEILSQQGVSDNLTRRRFNDKERDDLTGLSYYGFRNYDPVMLGWTQADPLFRFAPDVAYDVPRRTNAYTFSLNNPLRFIDPDGLQDDDAEESEPIVSECNSDFSKCDPVMYFEPDVLAPAASEGVDRSNCDSTTACTDAEVDADPSAPDETTATSVPGGVSRGTGFLERLRHAFEKRRLGRALAKAIEHWEGEIIEEGAIRSQAQIIRKATESPAPTPDRPGARRSRSPRKGLAFPDPSGGSRRSLPEIIEDWWQEETAPKPDVKYLILGWPLPMGVIPNPEYQGCPPCEA